ncbi:DUF3223 domain-containing protein [Tellurirhabdus bombi]|uniref:DUF3223 domain-containing protein n=1 Tax=Tellurirhabdus bombi TaxID=2907205 RepID=UPI001F37A401|nr:DUF3223 domain-containing protein [Tellurirhabdus bombi]
MARPLKIGKNEFKFKKDALAFYKAILNSYNFGESLNDSDFDAVVALLDYEYLNSVAEYEEAEHETDELETTKEDSSEEGKDDFYINDIQVARVQFNTKCFEVFYSDETSYYISYLMALNKKRYDSERLFYAACRNSIHTDIHAVKQAYFDAYSVKGQVKCQETSILSKWTELVVDHRQPNTFSIIVDRFKEVNNFDLEALEYDSNQHNHIIFKDEALGQSFKDYHKAKAHLRIVRKECNSSRTGLARVKKATKDLTVK